QRGRHVAGLPGCQQRGQGRLVVVDVPAGEVLVMGRLSTCDGVYLVVVAQVLAIDIADYVRVVQDVVQVRVEDRALVGGTAGDLDPAEEAVPGGVGGRPYAVEVEVGDLGLPVGFRVGVADERQSDLGLHHLVAGGVELQ